MENNVQENYVYRKMIHELSCGLKPSNCESITYLSQLPEAQTSKPLNVLSCLEAHGRIGPWKLDHLESLLREIHREDLLPIVQKYKGSKEYKKKKKKETGRKAPRCSEEDGLKKMPDGKKKLRSLYTLVLSQITALTHATSIFREELDKIGEEDEGVDQAMDRFLKVVEDGDKFTDDLRAVLKDMGIKSNRSSASSVAASVGTATAATTPIHSPSSRRKPVPLPRGKHLKSPLVDQETGIYENLRQDHGSNISIDQYRKTCLASTPKWARRDAESEEDTTAENTTGTADSGISEWIAGYRTPSEFKGDSLDSIDDEKEKRYTPLLPRKFDDSSEYATVNPSVWKQLPLQDDGYARPTH